MHYNSNTKLYIISLIIIILLNGLFFGNLIRSDKFQNIAIANVN